MEKEIKEKPRKARSIVTSALPLPQTQRHHISDSQFQFSYDLMPTENRSRPLTVPAWVQIDGVGQPSKLKKSHSRRPDGNPVTGEGYEPQHYRPSYYGPLKVVAGDTQVPVEGDELSSRNGISIQVPQDDSSPLHLNSASLLLRESTRRPLSATTERKRVPPGGFSVGLW